MNAAERTVQALGLVVAPSRRARFVEEWQADLAAARMLGRSPVEIVGAAVRVAGFLLWIRVRVRVLGRRTLGELLTLGVLLGFVSAITDLRLDVLVPFVLLAVARWCWKALRAWIDGGR